MGTKFPLEAKDYELFEEIRVGVRATVYRARCIPLDEIVTIKIWNLENCLNDVETIRKEAHCSFLDGSNLWTVTPYTSDSESNVSKGNPFVESSEKDVMSVSDSLLTEALSPASTSQLQPSLGEHVDIPSRAESSVCEEKPIEPKLDSEDNKQMENAENDPDKLQNEKVLTSGILASSVNTVSSNAAQILPLLENLLQQNEIQRERLVGLSQLYNPTAENTNPNVNTEGGQISMETVLASQVRFLEQSVEKLKEEVENMKKENSQLEEQINRLRNGDA